MQVCVWAVAFDASKLPEDLYQEALLLVDPASRTRIQRFYHREDSCRCLIGRLLPRMLLKERGLFTKSESITFAATETGKPYLSSPKVEPPIAFNVTHDSGLVAMAYGQGDAGHAPAYRVGVDVMKLHLPRRTTLLDFIDSVSEQLTELERSLLMARLSAKDTALRYFFMIWTMKEAYTKALGLGLGFEFRRVEYDIPNNTLTIDGVNPLGWEFVTFDIDLDSGPESGQYVEWSRAIPAHNMHR